MYVRKRKYPNRRNHHARIDGTGYPKTPQGTGLTQEELAEQLGVTFQAVSKWENGAGMPDISQVVPIAHVFEVSTDVLFGTHGTENREEVWRIIQKAQALVTRPLDANGLWKKYGALQEGLKLYPSDPVLLLECLETGVALAYPENRVYAPEHAKMIYRECIRYANLIISYSPNTNDILRARMIMVILHAAYGDFKEAYAHTEHFPWRADFNIHVMYAYCAHWKKDYATEAVSCQYGFLHYMEGMLNGMTHLAQAYVLQKKYTAAAKTLETALELIGCVFGEEEVLPPVHHREAGDLYMLLAEIHLLDGNRTMALQYLQRMVDYDIREYEKIDGAMHTASPLLDAIPHGLYRKRPDRHQHLLSKLTDGRFDALQGDEVYERLIKEAEALL